MNNRIISIVLILLIFVLGFLLVGEITTPHDDIHKTNSARIGLSKDIHTVVYDGHEYVIYDTMEGSSIVHKANCKYD